MCDRLAEDRDRHSRRVHIIDLAGGLTIWAIAFAAVVIALYATFARAHGPGTDWIWGNEETRWCCSVRHGDCRAAFDGEAVEQPDGTWIVGKVGEQTRTFQEGERGFYYSRELVPWLCQFPKQNVRCFFAPPKGF